MNKNPQFYDRYIRQSLGKTGPYARFLSEIKEDHIFKKIINKY
jgi:hypothetical protein